MTLHKQRFFSAVRGNPFGGRMNAAQVEGAELVIDTYLSRVTDIDLRHLAYMLATAFHETAATMQPVRETLATSDEAAIRILDRAYAAGRLGQVRTPYWRRDADGKSWLGRGLVQLTHRRNYEAMSALTGVDLVERPERAMEPEISALILIEGMRSGSFTGRRLSQHFEGRHEDWEGARTIINGRDRAGLIAGYGRAFHGALKMAAAPDIAKTGCPKALSRASRIEPATAG